MTDSEIGGLLGGFYDELILLKQQIREASLIALATKETLAALQPRAAEIYEAAYNEHSRLTARLHNEVIDEWRRIASKLTKLGQ